MSHPIVNTYEEACQVIEQLGILPLSSFIPGHPSLVSITQEAAWPTGTGTDPWLWRDHYAAGNLSRPAALIYECIRENEGIDVRRLRMLTGMTLR